MRRLLPLGLVIAVLFAASARAQQEQDSTYVPRVAKPAFTGRRLSVMIDQKHNNYFTMSGRYRAFAELLRQDGLFVMPGVQRFSSTLARSCQLLVVADASGSPRWNSTAASGPAFFPDESDILAKWVEGGGALLLIVDNAPFSLAMNELVGRFGVDMGYGVTVDTLHEDPETKNPGCLLFTREDGLIADHPITLGRDSSERIRRVVVFTGQSLGGPRGSKGFLVLSPTAADIPAGAGMARPVDPEAARRSRIGADLRAAGALPAVGRYQGLAFEFGKGRVVVLGDGAIFGAQKVVGEQARALGKPVLRLGLNRPDLDNQQLALNVVHWLLRVLD